MHVLHISYQKTSINYAKLDQQYFKHVLNRKYKMLKPIALFAALSAAVLPVSAETLHYNVVEFSESASIEVLRDTATARLLVHEEGKNQEEVSANFIKKLNHVTRKAASNEFKTELLHRSTSPRYEFSDKGKRTQTGWEEQAVLQVESKNFEAVNKLVADTRGEANLESLTFRVSKQSREDTVDEVSKAALKRFRDRAASLTKNMGFRNYKIVRLDFGQIGNRSVGASPAMMRSKAMDAEAAHIPEQTTPGTEEISITVRGTIQM